MTTIYIAPAFSDQAGQCRIYATDQTIKNSVRNHYLDYPGQWREVGVMNSRGKLVCFDGTDEQRQELIADQPLMAGIHYTYESPAP